MKTVMIYKVTCTKAYFASQEIGEGFSLTPFGQNTPHYEGYDDGGKLYVLPDGYEVSEFANQPGIGIFHGDMHCQIVMHSCGRPQLACGEIEMPVLDHYLNEISQEPIEI